MLRRRRLFGPDVQTRAGNELVVQRLKQRGFIMDEPARRRDEVSVRLHQRELACADHAAAFFRERTGDGDVVRAAEQFIEFHLLAPTLGHLRCRKIRVVGQHVHAEQPSAKRGDASANIAEPDDTDGLALRLGADQVIAVHIGLPPQRAVGLNNAFRQREQHCQSVFGDRMGIAAGLIDDQHARRRAGFYIHRIVARPIARDDQQVRRAPQQVMIDVKMACELIARRADLIGVRRRQDRRRDFVRALVLKPVEPHIRPGAQDVGINLVREVFDVEHALIVDGHRWRTFGSKTLWRLLGLQEFGAGHCWHRPSTGPFQPPRHVDNPNDRVKFRRVHKGRDNTRERTSLRSKGEFDGGGG